MCVALPLPTARPGVKTLFLAAEQRRLPAAHPSRGLWRGVRKGAVPSTTPCTGQHGAKRPGALYGPLAAICLQRLGAGVSPRLVGPLKPSDQRHGGAGRHRPWLLLCPGAKAQPARVRALLCPFSFSLLEKLEAAQAGAYSVYMRRDLGFSAEGFGV